MAKGIVTNKESWGSRLGLILAMAGSAVGFGNFLRFPVQAIQNGGGAFIIPYLVSFVLLGIPLLFIEWSTGRFGGARGHHSTPFILHSMNKKWYWKYIGVFGIFSNVTIAAYYCYLESWTLGYVYHSIIQTFAGLDQIGVAGFFMDYLNFNNEVTTFPYEALVFFVITLVLNTWILSHGLRGGIEKAAKIGVPLLIVFGVFLVIKGLLIKEGQNGAIHNGFEGLNFLWTPNFTSLKDPKVWLAAAGQIFFTLSVGLGCVQAYASYVKPKDDIALNAMSAGWLNEFVEVVIGGSLIIPISIGYLGIDKVVELTQTGALGLGFMTLPYLFQNWGPIFSTLAGVAFFGLLFFAGITSSLSMGTPSMGFFMDEFKLSRRKSAIAFAAIVLVLSLPTIFFFKHGVFDEYDYWVGTVSLVVFAMLETILFSWVFGVERGWKEINRGADIRIPILFKFVLKFVTPVMLIVLFVASMIRPANDEWTNFKDWELHPNSIVGQMMHKGIGPNSKWVASEFYAESDGIVDYVYVENQLHAIAVVQFNAQEEEVSRTVHELNQQHRPFVMIGDEVKTGDAIYSGKVINKVLYIDLARIVLVSVFVLFSTLVFIAFRRKKRNQKV